MINVRRLLHRIAVSVKGSSRRRRRGTVWGNCEIAETRIVLSSVTPVNTRQTSPKTTADQTPGQREHNQRSPADSGHATAESNRAGRRNPVTVRPARPTTRTRTRFASHADSGRQAQPRLVTSAIAAPPADNSPEHVVLARPTGVNVTNEIAVPLPDTPLKTLPPDSGLVASLQIASGTADKNISGDTASAISVMARSETPLATDLTFRNPQVVRQFRQSRVGGFAEIQRPQFNRQTLPSDLRFLQKKEEALLHRFSRRYLTDRPEQSDNKIAATDGAEAAAIVFFNRKVAGGFVQFAIDDLYGPSAPATAIAAPRERRLEAGVGRLSPFDDVRHATVLTSMLAHDQNDVQTKHGSDAPATPDVAAAGLACGLIGLRPRPLSRLWKAILCLTDCLVAALTGMKAW